MSWGRCLAILGLLLGCASAVQADLDVTYVSDGAGVSYSDAYYKVKDTGYWEAWVDKATGCIFNFVDLTDDGVGASPPDPFDEGDHVVYPGIEIEGTKYSCRMGESLFYYRGRSGGTDKVFCGGSYKVADLDDRLGFDYTTDPTKFVITYTETSQSTDFVWDPDDSAYAGEDAHRGDVLTTITLTLNQAAPEGTIFRMVANSYVDLDSEESVLSGMWLAHGGVYSSILKETAIQSSDFDYEIHQSYTEDETVEDGAWNAGNPKSYTRRAITDDQNNQDLGLDTGRTFALDHVDGFETGYLCIFADAVSGNAHYMMQRHPGSYSTGEYAGEETKSHTVDLRINICTANSDPVADAGQDQTVHDTDLNGSETVTLDGSGSSDSDGSIVSWVWKEGENQIATGETAQVVLAAGTHSVTLTVTDNCEATDDDTVTIDVNTPPVANAGTDQTVDDDDESGSETVTLDGSGSSDSDGSIASYVWKEGGNPIATGQSPQVSLAVGQHTIVLTVTDNDGATDDDTVVVTVRVGSILPVADAGDDQLVHDEDRSGSETVTLDGSDSSDEDGSIVSWVWKEGENQIATGETAQVSLSVGTHTVTLTVTDNESDSDDDTLTVEVNARPVADAGEDQEDRDEDNDGKEMVTLDGSDSSDTGGSIASWVWKEGENQIATGETAQVEFAVGLHELTLIVTDDDGAQDSIAMEVVVLAVGALDVEYISDGAGVYDSDSYYIVTSPGCWRAMVDEATGSIFCFDDLTDDGVQANPPPAPYSADDHVNYVGTEKTGTRYAGRMGRPLFYYQGKSGGTERVFCGGTYKTTDLDDRLAFELSPDKMTFTITYAEDAESTDFVWDPDSSAYGGDAERGYVLTALTLTLSAAKATGTVFRMVGVSAVDENAADDVPTAMWLANGGVYSYALGETSNSDHEYDIHQSYDEDETVADGAWDGEAPESFIRRSITDDANNNSLGLAPDRTFILDHYDGFEAGWLCIFSNTLEAGYHYMMQRHPGSYSGGSKILKGESKSHTVDLQINIGTLADGKTIDADKCVVTATSPQDSDDEEECTVTITLLDDAGDPVEGVSASDLIVSVAPSAGITVNQPTSDTDAGGQTTATITSTAAGTKTISVTVRDTLLTDTAQTTFQAPVTLTYAYGDDLGFNARELYVIARQAGVAIAQLIVVVPVEGEDETTNLSVVPGSIRSFKDMMVDSAWDYYGGGYAGLLEFGGASLDGNTDSVVLSETQNEDYYEITISHGYGTWEMDGTKVMRINKPEMNTAGDGYTIDIEGSLTLENTDASAQYVNWTYRNAGCMVMQLRSESMDGQTQYDGTFVNDDEATSKPNVHDTEETDDHPLYACADWYGTTEDLSPNQPHGAYLAATVKNTGDTADLHMRPGAVFEFWTDPEDMELNYSVGHATLESLYYGGGTTQESGYARFRLQEREVFGNNYTLDPEETVVMYYSALIDMSAPGGTPPPGLRVTPSLNRAWVYQNAGGADYPYQTVLTITIDSDTLGNSEYTVTVKEDGGALTNFTLETTDDPLVFYLVGGVTGSTSAGTYTINVKVEGDVDGVAEEDLTVVLREPVFPGFTGIDVALSGTENTDYAIERLWYDWQNDSNVVIYLNDDVQLSLAHNAMNIIGSKTLWTQGYDEGTIVCKIDGDEFHVASGNKYLKSAAYEDPPTAPLSSFQWDFSTAFTLAGFVGETGLDETSEEFYWGSDDAYGDEWHTLTFWDADAENTTYERDDQSNDGKIVYLVVNPETPAIAFDAPEGEQFYTTTPKVYYVPHIHEQKTYLTSGVKIRLANITNAEDIKYKVGSAGTPQTYSTPLTASDLFATDDTVYDFIYWLDNGGTPKTRKIHYKPAQPTSGESHPRLYYANGTALAADQAVVAGGGPAAEELLDVPLYLVETYDGVSFRTGVRLVEEDLFEASYFYWTKGISQVVNGYALAGVLLDDEDLMRTAVDGLLFLYTRDPLGGEDFNGRDGGPCQERVMYTDGRVTIDAAVAYDLLANFTVDNGYARGMTPIEHIKVRDNMAGEACAMQRNPYTTGDFFWQQTRTQGSPRDVQLECFTASLAMAMPTYDSSYYGTSGADGETEATHYWAPFSDAHVSWIEVNDDGYVEHPTASPTQFHYSPIVEMIDQDGLYVGGARDGYCGMMHQDVIPFLVYRHNFDGHHYTRFEKYLEMRLLTRFPHNSTHIHFATDAGSYWSADTFLGELVRSGFDDAGLYRWALEYPNDLLSQTELADETIQAQAPASDSCVTSSYAVLSSDLEDPDAVMMLMRVLTPDAVCGSGSYLGYWNGHFNINGYGERLAIDKEGYKMDLDGDEDVDNDDYLLCTSQKRRNTVTVEETNDANYKQPRGEFTWKLLAPPPVDYVQMETDLNETPTSSAYYTNSVELTRRVFFIEETFFIIVDTLESGAGSKTYDWLLHGATGGNTAEGHFVQDNNNLKATWEKTSGVSFLCQMIGSSTVTFNATELNELDFIECEAPVTQEDGIEEPYIRARTSGTKVHYLVVLYPLDDEAPAPTITEITTVTDGKILKISGGPLGGDVVVAVNTGTGSLSHNNDFLADTNALITLYKLDAQEDSEYLVIVDGTSAELYGTSFDIDLGSTGTSAQVLEGAQYVDYNAVQVGGQ